MLEKIDKPPKLDKDFLKLLNSHRQWGRSVGEEQSVGDAARESLTPRGYMHPLVEAWMPTRLHNSERIKAKTPGQKRTALLVRTRAIIKSDREGSSTNQP